MYDVDELDVRKRVHSRYTRWTGTWRFIRDCEGDIDIPIYDVCEESRYETLHSGFIAMTVFRDVTQRKWFNTKYDTLFLTTNAEDDGEYYDDGLVLALMEPSVNIDKVKNLAIGWGLWADWWFAEDKGS
jgi:hypothetical protein